MGADLTINSRNEDAAKVIQEKTGAHAAVVTAVAKAAFNSAVDAVRAGGRVVAVGLPPEAMSLDIPRLVLDGIEVVGSLVGTRQDLVEAFQFAAEGKVVPKVTLRPLEDINAIFKEMEQGQIRGRMVIDLRSITRASPVRERRSHVLSLPNPGSKCNFRKCLAQFLVPLF